MLVAANERPGDRVLVAQTPGSGSDSTSLVLRVKPRPAEEIDPSAAAWPGA